MAAQPSAKPRLHSSVALSDPIFFFFSDQCIKLLSFLPLSLINSVLLVEAGGESRSPQTQSKNKRLLTFKPQTFVEEMQAAARNVK